MKIVPPRPDRYVSAEHHRLHDQLAGVATDVTGSGTTANRPTSALYVGKFYFDLTLNIPVWYDGTQWVDAAGVPA